MWTNAVQERLNALAKEREELQSSNSGLQKELRTQGKQLEDEQVSIYHCITHHAMSCVMHTAVTQAGAHACTGNSLVFLWLCMTMPRIFPLSTPSGLQVNQGMPLLHTFLHLSLVAMALQSSVEEAKQAAVEAGAILQMEQERRAAAYSQLAACQDNNAGLQQQLSHAMEAYGCATQANNALLVCLHIATPTCHSCFDKATWPASPLAHDVPCLQEWSPQPGHKLPGFDFSFSILNLAG